MKLWAGSRSHIASAIGSLVKFHQMQKGRGQLQPRPFHYQPQPAQALPILNILVLQVGQTPWVAGLPFFIVMALGLFISFFERHLTQYACAISSLRPFSQG
jgi:hypothetical protein